jgi:anti-anti-sigma factor
MFTYNIKETDTWVTVYFEGDFDIDVTEVIEDEVGQVLKAYQNIKIDLSKVPFVDSSGIGLLLNLVEELKEQNSSVQIINVQPDVGQIFDILQLSEILGKDVLV